jgi:hypothetical protein
VESVIRDVMLADQPTKKFVRPEVRRGCRSHAVAQLGGCQDRREAGL